MTSCFVQDIKITREETKQIVFLGCGVRIEMCDETVRILSEAEWMRVVRIFPTRLLRMTEAFFAPGKRRTSPPIIVWMC